MLLNIYLVQSLKHVHLGHINHLIAATVPFGLVIVLLVLVHDHQKGLTAHSLLFSTSTSDEGSRRLLLSGGL